MEFVEKPHQPFLTKHGFMRVPFRNGDEFAGVGGVPTRVVGFVGVCDQCLEQRDYSTTMNMMY